METDCQREATEWQHTQQTLLAPTALHARPRHQQVQLLSDLLLGHLRHGRLEAAAEVLSVLALRHVDVPAIVSKAGLEVLQRLKGHRKCADYYNLLGMSIKGEDETLFLELSFYLCSVGQVNAALQALELRLPVNPFNKNPLYHGYAGVYEVLLYEAEVAAALRARRAKPSSATIRRALQHLRQATALAPGIEMFAVFLAKTHLVEGRPAAAGQALADLRDFDEDNPASHRLLYEHVTRHEPDNLQLHLELLAGVLETDGISSHGEDAVSMALGTSEHTLSDEHHDAVSELAIFYQANLIEQTPGSGSSEPLWSRFGRILERVPTRLLPRSSEEARKLGCWARRLGWWQVAYLSALEPAVEGLDLAKARCATVIYGLQNDFTRCVIERCRHLNRHQDVASLEALDDQAAFSAAATPRAAADSPSTDATAHASPPQHHTPHTPAGL